MFNLIYFLEAVVTAFLFMGTICSIVGLALGDEIGMVATRAACAASGICIVLALFTLMIIFELREGQRRRSDSGKEQA